MGAPYSYDDVKLTCPFCKSKMEFHSILIDQYFEWPEYIDYFCTNTKCNFDLRIKFIEFEKRIKK